MHLHILIWGVSRLMLYVTSYKLISEQEKCMSLKFHSRTLLQYRFISFFPLISHFFLLIFFLCSLLSLPSNYTLYFHNICRYKCVGQKTETDLTRANFEAECQYARFCQPLLVAGILRPLPRQLSHVYTAFCLHTRISSIQSNHRPF
jgi:hypothetical protein